MCQLVAKLQQMQNGLERPFRKVLCEAYVFAQDRQFFLEGNAIYFVPKRQLLRANVIQVSLEGKGNKGVS